CARFDRRSRLELVSPEIEEERGPSGAALPMADVRGDGRSSALAELEASAGALAAVLLALLLASVAGEVAGSLERVAVLLAHAHQGASDPQADRAGLAGEPSALDRAPHVVL